MRQRDARRSNEASQGDECDGKVKWARAHLGYLMDPHHVSVNIGSFIAEKLDMSLRLWLCSAAPNFARKRPLLFAGADAAVLVHADVSPDDNEDAHFAAALEWKREITRVTVGTIPFAVVGRKEQFLPHGKFDFEKLVSGCFKSCSTTDKMVKMRMLRFQDSRDKKARLAIRCATLCMMHEGASRDVRGIVMRMVWRTRSDDVWNPETPDCDVRGVLVCHTALEHLNEPLAWLCVNLHLKRKQAATRAINEKL